MKRKSDWERSGIPFSQWAQPGDKVDQAIVDHFAECCVPESTGPNHVQCGEPYDTRDDGAATYMTFFRIPNHGTEGFRKFLGVRRTGVMEGAAEVWVYAGQLSSLNCY